jgi:hypothetical protein
MIQTKLYKSFIFLVELLLVTTLLGPPVPLPNPMAVKAQPILVQIASSDPDQVVNVIVQKTAAADNVGKQVIRLGGTEIRDLNIINSLSAEMTAGAALEIARSSDVRWGSLDAPVVSTGCAQCVDTSKLTNAYISAIKADQVWNNSPYLQGTAIGVAVVDSGVNPNGDLYTLAGVNRQVADVRFSDFKALRRCRPHVAASWVVMEANPA